MGVSQHVQFVHHNNAQLIYALVLQQPERIKEVGSYKPLTTEVLYKFQVLILLRHLGDLVLLVRYITSKKNSSDKKIIIIMALATNLEGS